MARKPTQPIRPLCRGTTKTGAACTRRATRGHAYCPVHGGSTKPLGRKPLLNDDLITRLEDVVRMGVAWHVAAQSVGIAAGTLHGWRARGAEDLTQGRRTLHAQLVERLTRAQAEAEALMVDLVRRHALVDWRAAAWILERRHHERWAGKQGPTEDEVTAGKPVEVTPEGEARDRIVELLAAATKPPAPA